jgi:hypothetical protein
MKIDKSVVVRIKSCKEDSGVVAFATRNIECPSEFANLNPV